MNPKLQWLRNKMNSLDMQGIIISNPVNIKYLTNIDAEGTLLLTRKENIYITDGRYIEHVHSILTIYDEIIVYDKLGNVIKSKSKAIAKQMNETAGKKYTTIYQGFYDKGKFVGKNEVNRYYTKDGKLLLKVNASTNNKGYKHVTKQAPVGEYVLKGEKRHLASNALDFDSLAGTSAMAQSTRTNGTIRHTIDTTAEDALDTIKLAQEKGFAPRCGVLELEKL